LIKNLEEQGQDVFKENIKMEGIQKQLAEEEVKIAAAKEEVERTGSEIQSLTKALETGQMQFDALAVENFLLKQGKSNFNFWPHPVVYSLGDSPLPSFDFSMKTSLLELQLTTCVHSHFLKTTLRYPLVSICIIPFVLQFFL
jgi:hypothetical protein